MDPKTNEMISNVVKQYLSKNKVKIVIGTPCFGGMLHNGYFQSMLELAVNFTKLNIPFEMMTIGNESLIQRARNGIVARFMADNSATHLMFIDADITFSWFNIVKLLISGKELCGGCYPKKCFNWDKIKHQIQKNPALSDDELMAKSLDYVFNPIYHKEGENVVIKLNNGMAQVKDIGTGFMLINKSVIHKMMKKYPETKFRNNVAGYGQNNVDDYFYALFDCCIDPVSRVYLSEDYLFCKRWIDIGGELWLDLSTNLNHTGIIDYKGCLSITIGEVDNLNKDSQIMNKQKQKDKTDIEQKDKEKDKELLRKKIEEQVKIAKEEQERKSKVENTIASMGITNTTTTNTTTTNKKKKKKNKKKNNTSSNDNSNKEIQLNELDENENENENDDDNEDTNDEDEKEEEKNTGNCSNTSNTIDTIDTIEICEKMKTITHC
jgi:hypothetical protein